MLDAITRHRRLTAVLRWVGYLAVSWIVLRPALLVTISGDDLVNPFFVYDRYGSNPARVAWRAAVDVFRNGHFNVVGQVFGAWVFTAWSYLLSWGVRFSLIYAATKFVVIVGCAIAAGRLLRALGAMVGWQPSVWRARILATTVLLVTLQVHVPWGSDPVGSFPLFGYLPAAIGLLAMDVVLRAMQRDDNGSALVSAVVLCGSILYYELNVAAVVALVPAVVLLMIRSRWRRTLGRFALIAGPATVMSLVLIVIAKRTNRGYTGTEVDVGGVGAGLVARTVGGSLPASAWGAAHDWLGGSFELSAAGVVTAIVAGVAVCLVATWRRSPGPTARWWEVLLVAAVPLTLWLAATAIQTVTSKIDVDTAQLGYVYTYYAYGSVGVALGAILAVQALPRFSWWRVVRPVLVVGAVLFTVVQVAVNDTVVRAFAERLAVTNDLLVVVSSDPAEASRCAALAAWVEQTPFLPDGYHRMMVDGLNVTWHDRHGELFCSSGV